MSDYLLFDLDGTLTDPADGITKSVAFALKKFGIEVPDRRVLYPFIGPPLLESFHRFYGLDEAQCREALAEYRAYFRPTGMFENTVYPGIPELLERLCAAGKKLAVATSKPELFAREILRHFELDSFFTLIAGASMDETRVAKADVIAYALEALGNPAPARCRMVGDREHDIQGAHRCGLRAVGVLYGYGSREELTAAGADWIAENVDALLPLLSR